MNLLLALAALIAALTHLNANLSPVGHLNRAAKNLTFGAVLGVVVLAAVLAAVLTHRVLYG